MAKESLPTFEKLIDDRVIRMLIARAKSRAASLKNEAKPYWHTDRDRFNELRARAEKFRQYALFLEELKDPFTLAYPAKPLQEDGRDDL